MDDTGKGQQLGGLEIGRHRILHPGPLRWLRALGWMVVVVVLVGGVQWGMGRLLRLGVGLLGGDSPPLHLAGLLLLIAVSFGLYWLLVRFGEGRDAQEMAPGAALGGLAVGAMVGIGMFSVVMAALVLSGAYQLTGPHGAPVLADINMALSSGFLEELMLRAIIFRLVMRAFGVWPALLFSAALFGGGHIFNPNATIVAAVAIAVEAGLSLGALYLATGRVWAAIGFHVAWNFVQAYVFGARVSGIEMKGSLWTSIVNPGAPEWLSGGAFGPEASAPAMVAGTIVAIVALFIAHRRGNLRALPDPG